MNLTTHIFLEQPRVGRTVLNPLSSDLISLQEEVRQAFGWSLEADDASANAMSILFQGAAPYNQRSWSTTSRDEALSNLEGAICSAKRLIAVGAGSDSGSTPIL